MPSTHIYPHTSTQTAVGAGTPVVIKAEPGVLIGISFISTNASVISIYDNASAASGDKIMGFTNPAQNTQFIGLNREMKNGIVFVQSGTCDVVIHWR